MKDDEAWEKAKRHEIVAKYQPVKEKLRVERDSGQIDQKTYNIAMTNVIFDCMYETLSFRTYLPSEE